MVSEQEKRLIKLLRKGVVVNGLFPREFSDEVSRYRVNILDKQTRFEIEISKFRGNETFVITKIINLSTGNRIDSELRLHKVFCKKPLLSKSKKISSVSLTGTIHT